SSVLFQRGCEGFHPRLNHNEVILCAARQSVIEGFAHHKELWDRQASCSPTATNQWPRATDQLWDPRMALPNQSVQKSLPSRLERADATLRSGDSHTRSSRDTRVG